MVQVILHIQSMVLSSIHLYLLCAIMLLDSLVDIVSINNKQILTKLRVQINEKGRTVVVVVVVVAISTMLDVLSFRFIHLFQ